MSGGSYSGTASSTQTGTDSGLIGRFGMKRNPWAFNPVNTGYSSMDRGVVRIDPSIRAIQDKGLARIDELYGQTGAYGDELIGNTRTLRNRFLGNQSDYANAQLNPLRQQIANRRGELQRGTSIRGLTGSSFGDQAMSSFDFESQRALQDASANVEMQQLQALTGIDANLAQQMFGKVSMQSALNGESLDVAKNRLEQELRALGLGMDQVRLMTNAFESYQNRDLNRNIRSSRSMQNSESFTSGSGKSGGGSG